MLIRAAVLVAGLAGPVLGDTAAPCDALVGAVTAATGLALTAPPAGPLDGWCVLNAARAGGDGPLRVSVETLRVRGEVGADELSSFDLEATGLRLTPALSNKDLPDWARDMMRLQSADVSLALRRDAAGDLLLVNRGRVDLSGGGALEVMGEIAGAKISAASILTGRLTELHLDWTNDGRTLRPLLEAMGASLEPGATGSKAIDAARARLHQAVEALPASSLVGEAQAALETLVDALPQGRGRLTLDFASDAGIGAAQLGMLALADNPAGPEALGRFLAGSSVTVDWQPGLGN